MRPASGLAGLLHHLDAVDEECTYLHGPPPPGWIRVDEVDPPAVDRLIERLLDGRAHGRRDAAGSLLAGWLSSAIVGAAGVALVLHGRTWPLDPTATWLRLHPDGWAEGIAATGFMRVGPDDPEAGTDGVTVLTGTTDLGRRWAAEAAALVTPLFDHLCSQVRFGLPGMWGSVADGVVGEAMWLASRAGIDPDRTWDRATELVDHLAAVAPLPPARQRRVAVPWAGGTHHASVRSTCCLHYRTEDRPDPAAEGYCTSCPLRTDDSRMTRLTTWLDRQASTAS